MSVAIEAPGPKIEKAAVKKAEKMLGSKLPSDYSRFLVAFNGGKPEDNKFDVPVFKTAARIRAFYGVRAPEEMYDLVSAQEPLKDRLPKGVIAIAEDSSGNCVCLSLRKNDFGEVFFWDHELEEESNVDAALGKIADSFDSFFALLQKHDLEGVKLDPDEDGSVWIDPEFLKDPAYLKSLKKP